MEMLVVTESHVAERAGSNASAAQEESARLPGAAEGDGPNVSGGSLCPEFGATRGGAAAGGGGREAEGQPAAVPRQSERQGTVPDNSKIWQPIVAYIVRVSVLWNVQVYRCSHRRRTLDHMLNNSIQHTPYPVEVCFNIILSCICIPCILSFILRISD